MKTLDDATARRLVREASSLEPVPAGEVESVVRRGRRRRRTLRATRALGAAVLVAGSAAGSVTVLDGGRDDTTVVAEGHEPTNDSSSAPTAGNGLPDPDLVDRLSPEGVATSCVALFSAESLRERAFAFDGTVVVARPEKDPKAPTQDLDMNRVEFEVHEWFAGGTGTTATVWVAAELFAGDRLLISGQPRWGGAPLEDAYAWLGCGGFTSAYTPAGADFWREATR